MNFDDAKSRFAHWVFFAAKKETQESAKSHFVKFFPPTKRARKIFSMRKISFCAQVAEKNLPTRSFEYSVPTLNLNPKKATRIFLY